MASITGSFHSATLALQQDQLALTATADNISNQNTLGYARRTVAWSSGDTVTLSGTVTLQAPVATVSAQRSSVLDAAVVGTTSSAASAATTKSALDDLQSVFAINSSGDEGSGINAAMSGFFAAAQAVAADPASTSARQAAFAAAQTVASAFRSTSATFAEQASGLEGTIQSAVGSVNQLTASIASLNGSIARTGNTADHDTLIDQRTAQIESLSQLIGVQQTANSDGSVSLFTSNGGALVVSSISNALTAGSVGGALQLYAQGSNITAGLEGGSIGGALLARDGILADVRSRIDALTTAFTDAVNTVNANGHTATGSPGQPIFTINAAALHPAASVSIRAASGADFASASSSEGSGGTANANALAALGIQKDASGNTFADTLSAVISSIGTTASTATNAAAIAASALTQATAHQQALSGVSLDTEAANLTQYQRSYQAEAKLLSILNQIMADSINLGTNTAVS
ncbi:flagellar hook-associated protein FlgK [Terriglobus sp.]|uniref:flagellar hook-associated protein FlgK n=1 Tax=Terriglobus sp. TaxID=1889013 RepID=UPI003B00C85D